MGLSDKQRAIINSPLESFVTQACAGSGKTKTAVNRVIKLRELLDEQRTHVLLLSFSNVAVRTFKTAFSEFDNGRSNSRVGIETFDSFLTSNVIRPHAYRTMQCDRTPFLVTGNEPFLQNPKFTFWRGERPNGIPIKSNEIGKISVERDGDSIDFYYRYFNQRYKLSNAAWTANNLARTGAYTHELGKYWSVLTLLDQPDVLRVLANRYKHIVVDEAQDLGSIHCLILEMLIEQGVTVSLVGDSSQAIYEFTGADGSFMNTFAEKYESNIYPLNRNYRSVKELVDIASKISNQSIEADKGPAGRGLGGFFMAYDPIKRGELVDDFSNRVDSLDLSLANSAVLCRANTGVEKIRATTNSLGTGKLKLFAKAAVARDAHQNYHHAYDLVSQCILSLLQDVDDELYDRLKYIDDYPELRQLQRLLWRFVKAADLGLPSANLKGESEWIVKLKENIKTLFADIEGQYGLKVVDRLGNKLTKRGLSDEPLVPPQGLLEAKQANIRVDNVHQVKGESLDAVLYIADKSHIDKMLAGVDSEDGRIGYVALTRAKSLFVLGVPINALKGLKPSLEAIGLKELV